MFGISLLTFLLGTFLRCVGSEFTTEIVARAPVKPVKEREILSLHCKATDIPEGYVVTVTRHITGEPQPLSWAKGVVQGVDDRTYLAVRQLRDGSSVYFLTITDVTKKDEGRYQCQVVHKGTYRVIAMNSVVIPIQYFPTEKPKCSPASTEIMRYKAGEILQLNCSSLTGYPPVEIKWSRAGADITDLATSTRDNTTTYSTLTVTLTEKDDGAVFECRVTSKAFRGKDNRCHSGPISVKPDPNYVYNPTKDKIPTLEPPPVITRRPSSKVDSDYEVNQLPSNAEDCSDVCQSPPSVKYWILACSAAGALALIFLLSVLILLIKYCESSKDTQQKQRRKGKGGIKHHTAEEIYTELEYHRDQQALQAREATKVYMSLQKNQQPLGQNPEQPALQALQQVEEERVEGRDQQQGTAGVPTSGTPVVYKSHYV